MKTNIILYVSDQTSAQNFYRTLLNQEPSLDVPGMTEFRLGDDVVLGLMPERGIVRLLGDAIVDPASANGVPRCELYLTVPDATAYVKRTQSAGGRLLSDLQPRDWGDRVAYCQDPDGHVLAFAEST